MSISALPAESCRGVAGTVGGSGTPPEQSASCIVAKTTTGSHTITIDGYSRIKEENHRVRDWTTSAVFTVSGHSWSVEFLFDKEDRKILLLLRHRCGHWHCCTGTVDGEKAFSASYVFSFLDHNLKPFDSLASAEVCTFGPKRPWHGSWAYILKTMFLDESRATKYLRGDCLKVRCDVTVYKDIRCEDRRVPSQLVAVPPSDIGDHLGRLLSTGVGTDLTFEVSGEGVTFAVHRHILALRSPLLLEEIDSCSCCLMMNSGAVEEARVFKALLHYIYTDSLAPPEINDDDDEMEMDMARHLIAAANRYSLDRLKLICEDMLSRRVDTSRVADMFALAEQCHCHGLKKACVRFLRSGSNLKDSMETDGFERLRSSFPALIMELLAMQV